MRLIPLLAITLLLAACKTHSVPLISASPGIKIESNHHDYSFELIIDGKDKFNFDPVTSLDQASSLFGLYKNPTDYTSGIYLRIYPNMKFTITDWCDICSESLIAAGSYTFVDGKVTFTYSFKEHEDEDERLPEILLAFHGWIDKKAYVTGSKFVLVYPTDLSMVENDSNFDDYFSQAESYLDWQAIYDNEVEMLKKATPEPNSP